MLIHSFLYMIYQTRSHCNHVFSNYNGTSTMLNNFEHYSIYKPFQRLSSAPNAFIRAKTIDFRLIYKDHMLPILNYLILELFSKFQANTYVIQLQQWLLHLCLSFKTCSFQYPFHSLGIDIALHLLIWLFEQQFKSSNYDRTHTCFYHVL